MKKRIYPAIIFSALTLAACGGGGGGGNGSGSDIGGNDGQSGNGGKDPVAAPKLVDSAQTIDYFGDSTIFGWATSASDQVDVTAPEAFASGLTNRNLHKVNNKGVSGQTACELLEGRNVDYDWTTALDQSNATVVILNHGINDAVSSNAVSVDQYRSCLRNLVQIAEDKGKRVIFETPNPIDGQERLVPYVEAMKQVADDEGLSVIDQFAYLNQQYANDAGAITRDGLHPTDDVYIEKGQYAARVFNGLNR